jgi:hypothetical protein
MFRPWQDNLDPLCGRQGNSLFFNSNYNPPEPTGNYLNLLSRGWMPLEPENYLLPKGQEENPCNAGTPVISNVTVFPISRELAIVSWNTDIPATSQVSLTHVASGVQTMSNETTNFVTSHSVTIESLTPNTLYGAQAISKSSSGQSAQSEEIQFRTSR